MEQIEFSAILVRHGAGIVCDPLPVYYERIEPVETTDKPTVVMIHGGSHSGSCYQLTMDGRPGWAYLFAGKGYPVVVADWPGMGRSGASSSKNLTSDDVCQALSGLLRALRSPLVLLTHSMSGPFGWRIFELNQDLVRAVIGIAPGPPGNIQKVPAVVPLEDGTLEVRTPFRNYRVGPESRVLNSPAFVVEKLIGASKMFPRETVNLYAASLLETASSLLMQRLNANDTQVRVSDPSCFRSLPVLVVTGTEDLEHRKEDDLAIVEWMKSYEANVEFMWLGDHGLVGNGHMMMLESNSDKVGGLIINWLDAMCNGFR